MRTFNFTPHIMATAATRLLLLLLLGVVSVGAHAADQPSPDKPVPNNLEPLPPPPAMENAPNDEPEVTITKEAEQTVEEYRMGGKLYMIKITPKHGKPYYMVDDHGDGKFARQESLDSGFRPPRWVIHRF